MADLRTEFLGLKLKSPVIAGSSGMTSDINHLIALEKAGVGAVILKSIFEEQINRETTASIGSGDAYPEAGDYIRNYIRANTLEEYVKLLKTAKSELGIPVIPSINCMTDGGWVDFARHLEDAGADAVEVNAFVLPVNPFRESADVESVYYRIIKHLKSEIKIPVLFKIGHNFTNLPMFVSKLKGYGADGVTIFNRFFEPDIDIDKMEVGGATVFTTSSDIRTDHTLDGYFEIDGRKLRYFRIYGGARREIRSETFTCRGEYRSVVLGALSRGNGCRGENKRRYCGLDGCQRLPQYRRVPG